MSEEIKTIKTRQRREKKAVDGGAAIAAAIAAGIKAAMEQMDDRPKENLHPEEVSAFKPKGQDKGELTRDIYFCGRQEREDALTPKEIELYNKLEPGNYNNGTWLVAQTRKATINSKARLEISVPAANQDLRGDLPKLILLLKQCHEEAAEKKAFDAEHAR